MSSRFLACIFHQHNACRRSVWVIISVSIRLFGVGSLSQWLKSSTPLTKQAERRPILDFTCVGIKKSPATHWLSVLLDQRRVVGAHGDQKIVPASTACKRHRFINPSNNTAPGQKILVMKVSSCFRRAIMGLGMIFMQPISSDASVIASQTVTN